VETKGIQKDKIKAIMEGNYASMVTESFTTRTNGLLIGGIGGLVLGGLLGQNMIKTGLIGAIIGFVITFNK